MEQVQWITLVQVMQAMWPQAKFPPKAMQVQYEFVKSTGYESGLAAVKDMAARDWPPNSAQVAQRAMELEQGPEPDFDEVVRAFDEVRKRDGGRLFGANAAPPAAAWDGFHPRVGAFFSRSRWRLWCSSTHDGTFYAQQRDEYRMGRARAESEQRLLALGVDVGALAPGALSERGLSKIEAAEGALDLLGPGSGRDG